MNELIRVKDLDVVYAPCGPYLCYGFVRGNWYFQEAYLEFKNTNIRSDYRWRNYHDNIADDEQKYYPLDHFEYCMKIPEPPKRFTFIEVLGILTKDVTDRKFRPVGVKHWIMKNDRSDPDDWSIAIWHDQIHLKKEITKSDWEAIWEEVTEGEE